MSATAAPGAGAVVLVGTAAAVASLVVLHILPTGLSPVRNAVSHYGTTRYRAGYRALTISMAVAGFGAVVGLAPRVPRAPRLARPTPGSSSATSTLGPAAFARPDQPYDDDFPGMRRFYSEDPHGNRLEFLEPIGDG